MQKETPLYGSKRLGVKNNNKELLTRRFRVPESNEYLASGEFNIISGTEIMMQPGISELLTNEPGRKQYEITNHLGNVMLTINDKRTPVIDAGNIIAYNSERVSANDYYPFGMLKPTRSFFPEKYKFGFQGQEKLDEISSTTGGHLAFEYRIHDARIGRFLSVDPLTAKYPFYSPYAFSGNRVIDMVELEGLEPEKPGTEPGQIGYDPEGGSPWEWTGDEWIRQGFELREVEIRPKSWFGYAMDKVKAALGRFLHPKYGEELVSDIFLGIGSPRVGNPDGNINVDFMFNLRNASNFWTKTFLIYKRAFFIIKQIYSLGSKTNDIIKVIDEITELSSEKIIEGQPVEEKNANQNEPIINGATSDEVIEQGQGQMPPGSVYYDPDSVINEVNGKPHMQHRTNHGSRPLNEKDMKYYYKKETN